MRRRIAVITARADASEQRDILYGISEAAFRKDTDVVVYSNIYNHWQDDDLLNYENIIYSLFEPDLFDGVIVTAEAFRDITIINDAIDKIRAAKIPAIVIDGKIDGFKSVYSDDETDLEKMTEHLITVHGFTDIDILTGSRDNATSQRRLNGCKRAFGKHGISLDNIRVYYGNFWNDSGEELARRYLSGEIPRPQAVICTNDSMAFGLCDVLSEAGVDIPGELTVTGYDQTGGDHTAGRIYHYPLLTTYRRNRRKMGRDAVVAILGGSPIQDNSDRFVSGNTCSCGICRSQLLDELIAEKIDQYHTVMSTVAQFSGRLTTSRTLEEYTGAVSEFFYLLHGADRLFLCLDSTWNSERFNGDEFLCCAIGNEYSEPPIKFSSGETPVPFITEHDSPVIFYVNPVCFQTRLYGYTVLEYNRPASYDFSFRDWNKTVADTLEFLRMKNDIHYLTQCQRQSALYDSLTGFYNLREFESIVEEAGHNFCIQAVKLSFPDGGEYLFGENYRSDIIAETASSIKRVCAQHEICCRTDDNTFLILFKRENGMFPEKLKISLHNEVYSRHDERQVIITYHSSDNTLVGELRSAVSLNAERDVGLISERRRLPHYNELADIRNRIISVPNKMPKLSEVSRQMCVSEGHFRLIYRQCFDVSYNRDCINSRVMKACYLLYSTAMSIYATAVSCGYDDEKFFSRQFRQVTGFSPAEYRKKILQ